MIEVIGQGQVLGGSGVTCGRGSFDCYAIYSEGTINLTETRPLDGWTFDHWTGCDVPNSRGPTCSVATLDGSLHEITATFVTGNPEPSRTLSASVAGLANGYVTGGGIDCGDKIGTTEHRVCSSEVIDGSELTLVAVPDVQSVFVGWSGACSGTGKSCSIFMQHDESVIANFAPASGKMLSVSVTGNGTVSGGGITCSDGSTCTSPEPAGSFVTLTATPDPGYVFTGWSTDCSGSNPTCTVQMDTDRSVKATFDQVFPLTVAVVGAGSVIGGTGKSEISCGGGGNACSALIKADTSVTLSALPVTGATFAGWSGACSGLSSTCTFTMSAAKSVTATFTGGPNVPLTVIVTGNGNVTGAAGAINCDGGACSANVPSGSPVTLTATPDPGSTFAGWSGPCAGQGATCTFTATVAATISATFTGGGGGGTTFPLTVTVTGNGVVSGGGIDCGSGRSTCSVTPSSGSTVTLIETPAAGATFQGWSGGCSGTTRTCDVSIDGPTTVVASFGGGTTTGPTLTLQVVGKGTVATPSGSCIGTSRGTTCRHVYTTGQFLTLTATPQKGATFLGWSGGCKGKVTTCRLTLRTSETVGARFSGAAPTVTLRALAKPVVRPAGKGFHVTLRFSTTVAGIVHVHAVRAGRIAAAVSPRLKVGPATVGLAVPKGGLYGFDVLQTVSGQVHAIHWSACLGGCRAATPASAGPFVLRRGTATVVHAAPRWRVTLHFHETQETAARVRVYRGALLALERHFAPPAGNASAGPIVLTRAGTYTFALTAVDGYGRVHSLTWDVILVP